MVSLHLEESNHTRYMGRQMTHNEYDKLLLNFFETKLSVDSVDLFCMSMDHSPSEQLDSNEWYTSVLIGAHDSDDFELALRIAKKMNLDSGSLRKWKKVRPKSKYKAQFERALFEALQELNAYIFAFSRNREYILQSNAHDLERLQRMGVYTASEERESWVRFGPFSENGGDPQYIHIPKNQAIMVIDIVRWVSRIYKAMKGACGNESLRWQLQIDKFPGGGQMDRLFQVLLCIQNESPNIRIINFVDSDSAPTDLLADNVAGMLNGYLKNGSEISFPAQSGQGGLIWKVIDIMPGE